MIATLETAPLEAATSRRSLRIAGLPPLAIGFLFLTATASILQSYCRQIINGDDIFEVWVDKASSIAQLVRIQRETPLAADPFLFHGLTFAEIHLFGVNLLVLRLTSLLGFLLMQVCLFLFVRRAASDKAAFFALAFPAITGVLGFTCLIRSYALLLGLFGLVMLSWQTAARSKTHRGSSLVLLALSIALAINTHYYGILILLPLAVAEFIRAWQTRRMDGPLLLSISAGMLGTAFLLPFLKGASSFRAHYQAAAIPHQLISQSYNYVLLGKIAWSKHTNHLLAIGLALFTVLTLWSCLRQLRAKTLKLSEAELAFLITLAALPFVGFLLGHYVTNAMEPRYVLGCVIGIAALVSIALVPVFRNATAGRVVLILLFVAFGYRALADVRTAQRTRERDLASLVPSPAITAALMASPTKLLYTEDIDFFGFASYYEPNADLRSRLVLVYSANEEMRWNHIDTSSIIVSHLKAFTPYNIVPYESVTSQPGVHIFLISHGGWNWLEKALSGEHAEVSPVGKLLVGDVVSVRFPNSDPPPNLAASQPGSPPQPGTGSLAPRSIP